jgi:hypothetical protein
MYVGFAGAAAGLVEEMASDEFPAVVVAIANAEVTATGWTVDDLVVVDV